MKYYLVLLSAFFCSLSFASSHTPLFDSCYELKSDTQSDNAQACRYFIQGFMASSHLTGVPAKTSLNKKSDFFARAYETRIGSASIERRQRTCDSANNQNAIINKIANNIPDKFETFADLQSVIIKAIKENQSCLPQNV